MQAIHYITGNRWRLFAGCWILLFILYLPAARSGLVGDTTGWLQTLREDSFWDYLNRNRYSIESLYQLTQFTTWLFYQIWGVNAWLWHLLMLTMHCLNVCLFFTLCRRILDDAKVADSAIIALAGSLLWAVAPYNVEVVVWEASFHYLQCFLIILCILLLAVRFLHEQKASAAWGAGILYFLSTFSLEQFYLTPLFILSLFLFYRVGLQYDKKACRKLLLFFMLPEIILFLCNQVLFSLINGMQAPHIGKQLEGMSIGYLAIKPPQYFFHLLWGRFLPYSWRHEVWDHLRNYIIAGLFYACLGAVCLYILIFFRRMTAKDKMASLFFTWMLISISILLPLWFPDILLSVSDRYMYLLSAFYFMVVVLLCSRFKSLRLKTALWALCAALNISLSVLLIHYWHLSTGIIDSLETHVLVQRGKTVLMLNNPASYKGIAMIGVTWEGEFKLIHDLFYKDTLPNRMPDVLGYNMVSPDDGAHVRVLDDSSVRVTLQHKDPWCWFGILDLTKLHNEFYRITAIDTGRSYDLVLQKDPAQFQLIYQVGPQLKTVDMSRKGVEQY